jgi:hypothetical protein
MNLAESVVSRILERCLSLKSTLIHFWLKAESESVSESESESESHITTDGLGIKHTFGDYDQIFITVRQLQVCWCGALSLTTGWVCSLQLLLALASAVIFGSESRGTRDHILLSQIRDCSFRRLLRLAGLRWRNSTPPPHAIDWRLINGPLLILARRLG